jgi:hypothetical protein
MNPFFPLSTSALTLNNINERNRFVFLPLFDHVRDSHNVEFFAAVALVYDLAGAFSEV